LIGLFFDTIKALFITASYRPDVVAGFGGYVSWPVILVARLLRISTIVHEQNVVPGRANKFLFRIADRIAVTFEETALFAGKEADKVVVTGNPIRASAFRDDKSSGIRNLGLSPEKFTILVMGGSQGAHFLNETFVDAMSKFDPDAARSMQVIHLTGVKDYSRTKERYDCLGVKNRVFSFVDSIEDAYSASDLIVTRAGSSAIFEAALFGRPMMLVPYPFAGSHQAENARVFAEGGAAVVLEEKNLSAEIFKAKILELFNDKNRLSEMAKSMRRLSAPRASDNLAEEVLSLGEKE